MISAVLPMAGASSRFFKEGYEKPKYMIDAKGKTLFEYAIESLPLTLVDKFVFIYLNDHKKWNVEKFLIKRSKKYDLNFELVGLNEMTEGQAQTVLKAKPYLNSKDGLIIYNIDTYFDSTTIRQRLEGKIKRGDGIIGAFRLHKDESKWSFAELDEDGFVKRTKEKEKISNLALTGFYHFTKAQDFFNIAEDKVRRSQKSKGEFYVAPMYNDLIENDKNFVVDIAENFVPLGTPTDYEKFCE